MSDKPIITSLLQNDFYKLSMWLFIYKYFPTTMVTSGFINRTISIPLAKYIDIGELREQFDHAMTVKFTRDETHWIAGTDEYGELMFPSDFINNIVKGFSLPPYSLERVGDEFKIEFPGLWINSTQWEIPCLLIINTLLNRARIKNLSRAEKDGIRAEGIIRLLKKIDRIKNYRYRDKFTFSDFGTRRCYDPEWHDYTVQTLVEELPTNFRGTSNCYLAKKYNIMAMGTLAHELFMVIMALVLAQRGEAKARLSQFEVCRLWSPGIFGKGLQTHLPDTFGSQTFFELAPPELAEWKAIKLDSGDPYRVGQKAINWFRRHGQDTKNKILIPCDGLDVDIMLKLHAHFINVANVSPGWGTNLTNDLGLKPVSIVVKPIEADGNPTVKLSDNISKATGKPEQIEIYKRIFGYDGSYNQPCMY